MTPTWIEGIVLAGALFGAVAIVGRITLTAARGVTKIAAMIGEDKDGKTLAQRHEETERLLVAVDKRLTVVEDVLSPPGKTPLPQRVDRLEEEVEGVREEVRRVGAQVSDLTRLTVEVSDRQQHADARLKQALAKEEEQ